jgi:hypothetical protein
MSDPCEQFLNEVESLYYWYLSSLEHTMADHAVKKQALQELASKLAKISSALVTPDAIYQNHHIRIRDYNRPSERDILHTVPHAQVVVDSAPGSASNVFLGHL